jgi:hypothetical protein
MKLHIIGEMKVDAECRIAALRQMTAEQLLHLGMRQVVYLRHVWRKTVLHPLRSLWIAGRQPFG